MPAQEKRKGLVNKKTWMMYNSNIYHYQISSLSVELNTA